MDSRGYFLCSIILDMLTMITGMARNGVIGKDNRIPWHLPADLQHFKRMTEGNTVLFGENTYHSIMGYYKRSGNPLPYGKIIVLSDSPCFRDPNVVIARSKQEVLNLAALEEIWVCGGMGVYKTFLDDADKLYITWVEADVEGDAYFPEIDFDKFVEVDRKFRPKDEKNEYDLSFVVYERKAG